MRTIFALVSLGLVACLPAAAQARCGASACDVDAFERSAKDRKRGTNDDQIAAAINAAQQAGIPTVRLGARTYALSQPITIAGPNVRLDLRGEGRDRTKLVPVLGYAKGAAPFFPMINIAAKGGVFEGFSVRIANLTLDQDMLRTRPEYRDPAIRTSNGHGIRVGDGWRDPAGELIIEGIDIKGSPGYGIGIQNNGKDDAPANNAVIRDVRIYNTGSDGIDTKTPENDQPNTFLTIEQVLIENFGLNEKDANRAVTFSGGIDLRYDSVTLRRITVRGGTRIRAAHGQNETNLTGINFRPGSTGDPARPSIIEAVHVIGGNLGISAANGGEKANAQIVARQFLLEGFGQAGIALGGSNLRFTEGCAYGGAPGSVAVRIDEAGADLASITHDVGTEPSAPQCPAAAGIGYSGL